MIVKEFYETREDGINLFRTYSDSNFKIQKVGTNEIYDEAIDIESAAFEYIETTEPIPEEPQPLRTRKPAEVTDHATENN